MSVLKELINADLGLSINKRGVNAYVDTDEYEIAPKARKELSKRLNNLFGQTDTLRYACGSIDNYLSGDDMRVAAKTVMSYLDGKGGVTQDDAVDALEHFVVAFKRMVGEMSGKYGYGDGIDQTYLKNLYKEFDAIYLAL